MKPRVAYSTNKLLYATNKDVLPTLEKSNVIYPFSCHCDSRHVCRTSQRLQDKIKQRVPNPSALALLSRNAYFLPVGANLPPRPILSLLLQIQPLGFTFYEILALLSIMMTVDFLFLPKAALRSIYLLLKPLSSKLLTSPSCRQKESGLSLNIVH